MQFVSLVVVVAVWDVVKVYFFSSGTIIHYTQVYTFVWKIVILSKQLFGKQFTDFSSFNQNSVFHKK